jgi:outer membrane protein assembly factor BamB
MRLFSKPFSDLIAPRGRPAKAIWLGGLAALIVAGALTDPPGASAKRTYSYDTPVQRSSPWPSMRRDRHNTGASPIRARYRPGAEPWRFRTGKGVFSTPVIDEKDTAYFGSADRYFYAVDSTGRLRWKMRTGEVIDSAATLGARDPIAGSRTVTFGSADEYIYRLRSPGKKGIPRKKRVVWRFHTDKPPQGGQIVNWWEGNVVTGPDGTLYAGNTGGGLYAISTAGRELWNLPTGNAVWSASAIDDQGRLFVGSVDAQLYGIDPDGAKLWSRFTVGFNTASAAIGGDGTVYMGSFDGYLYALDPATGETRWRLKTGDHIYSSAALEEGGKGVTQAIYTASADGSIYKISPDGDLVWRYDTGDPIRSSPVLGLPPEGESGRILYVGSSNGRLYAINTRNGRRRFSYDTTPRGRVLRDRNDLNASPALGRHGIWIAGEHGFLEHVPYEYCLKNGRGDLRCETDGGERFADDLTAVYPVTAGGSTKTGGYGQKLPRATTVTTRLVVRRGGETRDAGMVPEPDAESLVERIDPPFPHTTHLSADGRYLHIVPDGFLKADTKYTVKLAGRYKGDGEGAFSDRIRFTTERKGPTVALSKGRKRVSAFKMRRLALPLPPLLPSVNQIGFDSYDWIVGTVKRTSSGSGERGKLLLWVVGSRVDKNGVRVPDRQSEFAFPLAGRYAGNSIILEQRGFELLFTFGPVPLEQLQFRGRLDRKHVVAPGAAVYGEVNCPEVPNLGGALLAAGLCNDESKLISSGAYLTDGYSGPANQRPEGVTVGPVRLIRPTEGDDGAVRVGFDLSRRAHFGVNRHTADVMLVDRSTGRPLGLDYNRLSKLRLRGKQITGLDLRIPAGTELPEGISAHVMADVFPLGRRDFGQK